MTTAERLIDEIMAGSRIPRAGRRREVQRELRAHVDDFVNACRLSGRGEADIDRLLVERFGDPLQIAQQFAWVYRRERVALHFGAFLISTVLVSLVISAAAIAMQAGIAFGFGAPTLRALASRHTAIEALDILATATAYIGLIALGRFSRRPLALLVAVAAGLFAVFATAGLPPQFVLFGFANGTMLRAIQVTVRHPAARLAAGVACFAALGAAFFHPYSSALAATAASWLTMGSAYHLMTHVVARVDRALLGKL